MLNKILGLNEASDTSDLVEEYLSEGEEIIKALKVWRDEVVITNLGIYIADAQGITGKKKTIIFYHKKDILGVTFDNNYGMSRDCDLLINSRSSGALRLKIQKSQADIVVDLVKIIKSMI